MKNIVQVDDDTYANVIKEERLVFLHFWTEWCRPCRVLQPVLEELAETYPELVIAKINADESETVMDEYGVETVPTLILFERGEPINVFTGKVPYPTLDREVSKHV